MFKHVFRYGGDFTDLIIQRAEGVNMYCPDGRQVLDFTSGQMSSILGDAVLFAHHFLKNYETFKEL